MSLFPPAWTGRSEKEALKAVMKLHSDKKLLRVVLEAPNPYVKKAAIERIRSDEALLRIMNIQLEDFDSGGSREYNLGSVKRYAFARIRDEEILTEAALLVKPYDDKYIDKIGDDALLYRLANAYYLPNAFQKIQDDQLQIRLARHNARYIDYVRKKSGDDWAQLLLEKDVSVDKAAEYARQMILNGDKRGVTVLARHLQNDLPPATLQKLEALRESYDGKELWTQIGLLGAFPFAGTEKYCRAIIDGGDPRGLDIMINAVKSNPSKKEAALLVMAIRELYGKAKSSAKPELLSKIKALPDGDYGRHADYKSTICGYTDHTDNGISAHFDAARL